MFEREILTLLLVSSQNIETLRYKNYNVYKRFPNSYEIDIKVKNSKVFKSYIE